MPNPLPPTDDDTLDPEIRAFRDRLAAGYAEHPALDSVPLAEARRIAEAVRAPFTRGGPAMARTVEHRIDAEGHPLRLRIHVPVQSPTPLPALIYLHGGGWRYFSVDTHDRLMREYAQRAGIVVVGVDYALAPETRYPRALRQAASAAAWVRAQGPEIGIDGDRLALGGDSAGANLALSAALLQATDGAPRPRALLLNYGTFRRDVDSESHRLYGGPAYTLSSDEMTGFWRDYLGEPAPAGDPLAEPLHAPIERLRGLPPSLLAIAQCDVLRDDSLMLAERLAAAGVEVQALSYPGTTHSFLEAMATAAVSRRALAEAAAWLRRCLGLPAGAESAA